MISNITKTGDITLSLIEGEFSMIAFDLSTFAGVPQRFLSIAKKMLAWEYPPNIDKIN